MHDLLVVGAGIMGAATARHAATQGADVAVIGEPEPESPATHQGLFGAWHDESRLVARRHAHPEDTELAVRSTAAIQTLEATGSVPILSPAGHLYVAAPGFDAGLDAVLAAGARGVAADLLDGVELASRYPDLAFPATARAILEHPPSGFLHPRNLVAAQLAAAAEAGAEVIGATVVGVQVTPIGVRVQLADGRTLEARRTVLATGAFSNTPAFLPRPLALRLKTETVLLAELTKDTATSLGGLPPVHFEIDSPTIGSIYTAPPITHPNGRILMKFGANTRHDRQVTTAEEIARWYRAGASDLAVDDMAQECRSMFPNLEPIAWHTTRCVITYTAHGNPIIDTLVDGRLYSAIGGNGHSAKWSDGIGGLAAGLALTGQWADRTIGPDRFRAVYEDEHSDWLGPAHIAG